MFILYINIMDYFLIKGGQKLSGSIEVNTSKNAAVAILAGSVLNKGTTTLKNVPDIEEVNRWVEILQSIGMNIKRQGHTMHLKAPRKLSLQNIDYEAAIRTRSIILLLGALCGQVKKFEIPQAGGCRLGARTIRPHLYSLQDLGVEIKTGRTAYQVLSQRKKPSDKIVLYESGDTVTENAILAAAQIPKKTQIRFASANYMVQDLCFFLQKLGVKISGVGTSTLTIEGLPQINRDITYHLSEDPVEAMFFLSLAIVTDSQLTIKRCPIDFLELELERLRRMNLRYKINHFYKSRNNRTNLVDMTVYPSKLIASADKIHALPFPGINMDNLPFFVPIACRAKGQTMIHDWVYENRAIYFSELNRLGADITLLDPHRILINGPVRFREAEMVAPPALRPAALLLVAMLGAKGTSILRNIYPINRGYENLSERLKKIGANIELVKDECKSYK